ncbi:transporter substrate-binding protein [Paracoccus sp. YIM 132242]|uniref:Transporter substrate-binding protein n=1 Tax=Paracoccus lichenicola TaxID=2665644 RepID=A0A6L6HQJ9_9RHOB|nr:transporter substrate-binding domain-containing protein [Paracoccus lichenicola]MTE01454.1 transporter substrate-binding protein [Paracoccus lichenicola]
MDRTLDRIPLQIGLLFSTEGPYGTVAQALLNGAMLACGQVNGDPALPLRLMPFHINPRGRLDDYRAGIQAMLDRGITHVCGCYTSSSRKEVLPIIEKRDALLWYPSHYEGFETSQNVVYTGSSPNQHLTPLIGFLFREYGPAAYCIGSNYIWAWESNRVFREGITRLGGRIAAERYVPVGETDLDGYVREILALRPDYIFNSLIGSSSYEFLRRLRRACAAAGIDQPRAMPVASCTLSEPELHAIGPDAADGQITSSVYFSSLRTARNADFVAAYRRAFPNGPAACADAEASYIAIHLLARAVARAGGDGVAQVRAAVTACKFDAPQGPVRIDPDTLHACLTPHIGVSRSDCEFDVLIESPAPVKPDPYLVEWSRTLELPSPPSHLRIVT